MYNTNLLLKISDTDFDPSYKISDISKYNIRQAARGLVISGTKIALLFVSKYNYYKLPGGGIETGESLEQAFTREILEEVGCKVSDIKQYGKIIEYRDEFKLQQISYVMSGQVEGEIGSNKLEPSEIEEGFELEWVPLEDAVKIMASSLPSNYEGQFIVKRDLYILEYLSELLN